MITFNPNKSVTATSRGINIHYTDSFKSSSVFYDERSSLKQLQVTGNAKIQTIVFSNLNQTQKRQYNLLMHGIKTLSQEEINSLSYTGKLRILNNFEDAQIKLNVWKQELLDIKLGSILMSMCPKCDLVLDLCKYPKAINSWEPCVITFKQLRVKKEQIIEKLMEWEMLPTDYYQLA